MLVDLDADVRAGMPIAEIARKYSYALYPGPNACEDRLRILDRMRYPPFAQRPIEVESMKSDLDEALSGIGTPPVGTRSLQPIVTTRVERALVIVVRPPGELRYDHAPSIGSMVGGFGMLPVTWESATSDRRAAVTFSIEHITYDGDRRVLLERTLEPVQNERDRGIQIYHLELPRRLVGQVVLRTSVVPDADPVLSWSYWTAVQFEGTFIAPDTK